MKKYYLVITLFLFSFLNAQIKFEKGYYLTNAGERIEGYIKNIDWKNNPEDIEFKSNLEEESIQIKKEKIKEFGIENISKFVRYSVDIEKSSNKVTKLQTNGNPNFVNEILLLKVLVDGKISLYSYRNGDMIKYFYKDKLSDKNPIQLIYIEYEDNSAIFKNESYKKQIFTDVNCNEKIENIKKLNYNTESLKKYFIKYNECLGEEINIFRSKKAKFNIKAEVKSNFYSFNFETNKIKSNNENNFGFGLEFEAILPFNNQKFSVLINPTYNNYKSSFTNTLEITDTWSIDREIDIKTDNLSIPIGFRYYMFINDNSKIFITPTLNLNYSFSKSAGLYINDKLFTDFEQSANFGIGLGYAYKKFFLEGKINTNMSLYEVISNTEQTNTLKTFSLSLKYQLF